jgi:hypothetical protein
MNYGLPNIFQMSAHDDLVVVPGWCLVSATGIGYSDKAAVSPLHVTIGEPKLPQHFYAPDLEPH